MSEKPALLSPAVAAAVTDAMLSGVGLFDAAERFGVSAASIVASTEESLTRRYMQAIRQAPPRRARRIAIPHWVPAAFHDEYRAIAGRSGEEAAARAARAFKRNSSGKAA